ncbi:hypothetical protein VSDG_05441 [Cytospora chrysosperma]|uniref:Uncharacterized protein n=1 Tax=Cytospora chrysosperma TaxID=252740 RepID=A0A423VZJ5_CYTCH|nr:hypothetical protein VSDG_05441 [Valsa sordida]
MAGIVNKVKEALSSDKSHEAPQGATGPHGSKVANTVDPRVDSDRDHRANPATGTNVGGYSDPASTHATHGYNTSNTGNTGTTGTTHGNVTGFDDPAGTHGPHGSRVTNVADPRVDSDRDHRGAGLGGNSTHTGTGIMGSSGQHTGNTGNTGHTDFAGSNTGHTSLTGQSHTGPTHTGHNDFAGNNTGHTGLTGQSHTGPTHTGHSDFAGNNNGHTGLTGQSHTGHSDFAGNNSGHTGLTGFTGQSHTGPTHTGQTGFASNNGHTGLTGQSGHTGQTSHIGQTGHTGQTDFASTAGTMHAGSSPGPAANTAGPHKSDMMNKIDPRVDSDLDGSKTYGGNKTYEQTQATSSSTHKDPTDAAQVPPSVMREAVGDPLIEHEDGSHGREGRHQSISHQEAHRGI